MTEDLVQFFNAQLGAGPDADLRPVPAARRAADPASSPSTRQARTVAYRWKADERAFAMPIRVGRPGDWQVILPTDRLGGDAERR